MNTRINGRKRHRRPPRRVHRPPVLTTRNRRTTDSPRVQLSARDLPPRPAAECLRCHYIWYPRRAGRPAKCPRCDSYLWDRPRTRPAGQGAQRKHDWQPTLAPMPPDAHWVERTVRRLTRLKRAMATTNLGLATAFGISEREVKYWLSGAHVVRQRHIARLEQLEEEHGIR